MMVAEFPIELEQRKKMTWKMEELQKAGETKKDREEVKRTGETLADMR
jgi:hypothetical protein